EDLTMNSTILQSNRDNFQEALIKNLIIVFLGIIINSINSIIVLTFFKHGNFYNDPRYILYVHLVFNDMLMICSSVGLYVLTYAFPYINFSVCCTLIVLASSPHMNTPLNLAGMAIERYIAICKPLHHAQICTVNRTYVLIGIIWVLGFIPGLTDLLIVVATQPLSFFTSVIFYYRVASHVHVSCLGNSDLYYFRVFYTARAATTEASSAKKAQNTIFLHGVQLLLCMLSYLFPVLDFLLVPLFPVHRTKITFFIYLITDIIPRLLSPLIYSLRDQKFVKHMSQIFSCRLTIVQVKATNIKLNI
uniref:G-protein coupled receptors family 1 profile domain-containing protein n=1 Tax=Denticeps clupeoides TaxID=299321 RepID=A0AAY4ESF9_9TELE